MKEYYVYIVKCRDNSYYTGVTNNLERRIEEHIKGDNKSAFTFSRRPVVLVWSKAFKEINEAIKKEKQIKGWNRRKKELLIKGDFDKLSIFSRNYTEYGKPTL